MAKKPKRGKVKTTYATKAQERVAKAKKVKPVAKVSTYRREVRLAIPTQRREIERLLTAIGDEALRAEVERDMPTMTLEVARFYIDDLLARAGIHGPAR